MLPVLYTIGSYNVYAFGVFLALSFILSTFLVWKFAREEIKEEEYLDAYFATCVAVLVSARAVYIFLHLGDFGFNVLTYILVRAVPGLSLFGGLFGGCLFLWWYARRRKYRFLHMADIFSIAFSFALVFTKIGEQLGGSSFGKATQSFIGVRVAGKQGLYHPVELYEAAAFLLIAIILLFLYRREKRYGLQPGFVAKLFAVGSLLIIFALEFLKEYKVYLYGLSMQQIALMLCMVFILTSIVYPLVRKKAL